MRTAKARSPEKRDSHRKEPTSEGAVAPGHLQIPRKCTHTERASLPCPAHPPPNQAQKNQGNLWQNAEKLQICSQFSLRLTCSGTVQGKVLKMKKQSLKSRAISSIAE